MPQRAPATPPDKRFVDLVQAIVSGDAAGASDLVDRFPELLHRQAAVGAARNGAASYFFEAIAHYMYAGDTALHMAAAGFQYDIVRMLIERNAGCSARNRRGAQPLHYAADANIWKPTAQVTTIESLIQAGADPNATDKSGVSPLHRAVRTRSAPAVEALLAGGAAARGGNGSGSTPLHLAVQNTGRGDSGTPHAREQQRQIIELLLRAGARPEDKDGRGKSAHDAATAGWIQTLLQA